MSNSSTDFCLDWHAGASAQVELFSPARGRQTAVYQVKYTPPFRSTIRPPLEKRPLGPGELGEINQQLGHLVAALEASVKRGPDDTTGSQPGDTQVLDQMIDLGKQLLDLVIPNHIQPDLRTARLFLEIGMDEALLEYPWELMHDGENFICLKHFIGRFVNAKTAIPPSLRPMNRLGSPLGKLLVLLISVPNPQPRDHETYIRLPHADAETQAIVKSLSGIEGVELHSLIGKKATYNEVWKALKTGSYHIVHFNGHALFNDRNPHLSSLILHDRSITTGPVISFFGSKPPILCFINGCETGRVSAWKSRYNIFGLARAFLETGSYLLGSRWKLNDQAAAEFATRFYVSLIEEGKSLGNAILDARLACKESSPPDDFGWASYVFYGDPRVCFRRVKQNS